MPSFTPTITTGSAAISISSQTDETYRSIVNSLGVYNYFIEKIYIYANTIEQVQQVLEFYKKDSNGEINIEVNPIAVDTKQFQFAVSINVKNRSIILDGRTTLFMNLMSAQGVTMYLTGREVSPMDDLPKNKFIDDDPFFKWVLGGDMKQRIDIPDYLL